MGYKHSALACFSFILIISLLVPQLRASQPTVSISSSPVNYGQDDRIFGNSTTPTDRMFLYINSNKVAGPRNASVNYTVCGNGTCLLPGTYAITVYDNTTGESTVRNLVIDPANPTFSVQYSNPTYGDTDQITAYPAFYNDTMSVKIDGSQISNNKKGVFVYTVCGGANNGEPCIAAGVNNVTVYDNTEGVGATSNKTIIVKPVLPTVSIQYSQVGYSNSDNITATAPLKSDSIQLYRNSTQIAGGTGSTTYRVCGPNGNQACIAPGTYTIYAHDSSENVNSTKQTLTVTSSSPTVSVYSQTIPYATSERINATAPNADDNINIYIDGLEVASGRGSASYTICDVIENTPCPTAGKHTISAYDSVEDRYAPNLTLVVTPVLPNVSILYDPIDSVMPDKIFGSAPHYDDALSILINGKKVVNGTGAVTYFICNDTTSPTCLAPGTYSVFVEDSSEAANSLVKTLNVLVAPSNRTGTTAGSTTVMQSTSAVTTIVSKVTTTTESSGGSGGITFYLEIAVVIVVVVIIASVLLRRRGGGGKEMVPANAGEAGEQADAGVQEQNQT